MLTSLVSVLYQNFRPYQNLPDGVTIGDVFSFASFFNVGAEAVDLVRQLNVFNACDLDNLIYIFILFKKNYNRLKIVIFIRIKIYPYFQNISTISKNIPFKSEFDQNKNIDIKLN